jgi:thiol-disulfide isomerase/thioredoxin
MRLILLFLLCVSLPTPAFSQQETVYFTDAIKPHLHKYNIQSDLEFERGNVVRGQMLFDSLVQNFLVGSRFEDYSFKCINGRKVKLAKIHKPVYITTYASWCLINKGEIPALNRLSRKYSKDVRFVVLFWDKKENVRKIARKFNGNISVCYAHETYRNDAKVVSALKHTLGFPTTYFLNGNREVVDITRGGIATPVRTTYRDAMNINYDFFNKRLIGWLIRKDLVRSQLATAE